MDSSSKQTLFRLFQGIAKWRAKLDLVHGEATIPWSKSHLSVVHGYILKLCNIESEFKLLKKLPFGEDLYFSHEMVASLMLELQDFFMVPKLNQLNVKDNVNALKKNELLVAFIDFLLQLLSHKTDCVHPFEDRIDHLKKELRFLVTVLGDTSLLGDEHEQVRNILEEFEAVANEAGSFVYSFIFAMDGVYIAIRMDDALAALLNYINHLRGNITNLSFLLPYISETNITPKTAAVDSLFIVDSLLHDLEDLTNRKHDLIVDVKAHITELHQQLLFSRSFLKDIKGPRHLDIKELKGPVMQIRDLAYEAEYLVNSFLVGDVPNDHLTIRLPDIIHKIKLVGTQLQEIKKNHDLRAGVLKVAEDLNAQLSLQAKRNFEVDEIIVGLEDEATHILGLLEGVPGYLQIITIFGMPGLGKTTLAKKLYNHPRVSYYFDKRSWCVVSQKYQRKNLLIDILISLQSELDTIAVLDMDEESLGEHIYKNLKGRRYLIVMDDVWDSNAWDDFRRYFPDDGNGSRILFTSRNKDVAQPNSIIYGLSSLSNDQCWQLLQKKVFHDEPCPLQLQRIGKEIAENCHGLPLAVVVVAGILSTMDKEESAWKNVGGSLASYIFSDQNNSTIQILKLSYNCLPYHLKPCFLYFGAFPEYKEIPVKKLKCRWIAEGFINKEEILRNAEIVAEEYLTELIDRSLVMIVKRRSDGGPKACVVHDLLHDLCLRIAEEENFLTLMDINYSIYTKHLRLHIHNMKPDPLASHEFFLPFGLHIRSLFGSSSSLNFRRMKLLKVLDFSRNELTHGDGSEHLVHLRYLTINRMPSSVGNFVNLEFLIVTSAPKGFVMFSVIQKLVKLKYLRVPEAYFDANCNSYQTNNLEYLSNIRINKVEDVEMLKCSPHLCKLKCTFARFIWDMQVALRLLEKQVALRLSEKQVALHFPDLSFLTQHRYPDLSFLTQLESLSLSDLIGGSMLNLRRSMPKIIFPSNIKKLTLYDSWLPYEKMSTIGGLPKLEILKLRHIDLEGGKWDTKDDEFQQLRFLELNNVRIAQWNVTSSEHFPKLQQLVLCRCSNLLEISGEIGEIVTLQSIEVELCPKSLAESASQIQQQQKEEMGNEELRVIIKDIY